MTLDPQATTGGDATTGADGATAGRAALIVL